MLGRRILDILDFTTLMISNNIKTDCQYIYVFFYSIHRFFLVLTLTTGCGFCIHVTIHCISLSFSFRISSLPTTELMTDVCVVSNLIRTYNQKLYTELNTRWTQSSLSYHKVFLLVPAYWKGFGTGTKGKEVEVEPNNDGKIQIDSYLTIIIV